MWEARFRTDFIGSLPNSVFRLDVCIYAWEFQYIQLRFASFIDVCVPAFNSVPSFQPPLHWETQFIASLAFWASFQASPFTSLLARFSVPSKLRIRLVFQSSVPSISLRWKTFLCSLASVPSAKLSSHLRVCRQTSSNLAPWPQRVQACRSAPGWCTSDNMSLLETYYRWGRASAVRVHVSTQIVVCEPSKWPYVHDNPLHERDGVLDQNP